MAEIEQSLQEIQQERSRLLTAKENLKTAIAGKGVTVPDFAKLDEYSSFVNEIQQGGGTDNVAGVLVDDGNGGLVVQKLSFDGTVASDDGEPVSSDKFYVFNTGKVEPYYGNAMEIYKCVYVDSVNKTWSGYLAVQNDYIYSFAATITENLTYGNGYTPVPGGIYDKEAMVTVAGLWTGLPSDGLVLHVPFTSQQSKAMTGQDIAYNNGSITFVDDWGIIPGYGTADVSGTLDWSENFTFTANFKASGSGEKGIFGTQGNPNDLRFLLLSSGRLEFNVEGGQIQTSAAFNDEISHFVALTGNGETMTLYVDGVNVGTAYYGGSVAKAPTIGWANASSAISLRGIRFYNRILSNDEQQKLMAEFSE